jgi:SAM-dependent methyltransferase
MSDQTVNLSLRRKIMGYIVSQAIYAVAEAGIADLLTDGPVLVADLARQSGVDADALGRFLRVLVTEELFTEPEPGVFALAPAGQLLRSDVPGSLRHFAILMAEEEYQAWSGAAHSLRTGQPAFERIFGKPFFDWLAAHPEKAERFHTAAGGLATIRLQPLLDQDWAKTRTVVDVGGGNGSMLATLLSAWPHLSGVLYDLPGVVDSAKQVLDDAGVLGQCRLVGGDFFAKVPAGADVYVLAEILHDWNDEQALGILASCHRAIPPHGRLLILEQVIDEDDQPHPGKLLDLHMLVLLGGRERTESDWRRLLRDGGFEAVGFTPGPRSSLIEARPI